MESLIFETTNKLHTYAIWAMKHFKALFDWMPNNKFDFLFKHQNWQFDNKPHFIGYSSDLSSFDHLFSFFTVNNFIVVVVVAAAAVVFVVVVDLVVVVDVVVVDVVVVDVVVDDVIVVDVVVDDVVVVMLLLLLMSIERK